MLNYKVFAQISSFLEKLPAYFKQVSKKLKDNII